MKKWNKALVIQVVLYNFILSTLVVLKLKIKFIVIDTIYYELIKSIRTKSDLAKSVYVSSTRTFWELWPKLQPWIFFVPYHIFSWFIQVLDGLQDVSKLFDPIPSMTIKRSHSLFYHLSKCIADPPICSKSFLPISGFDWRTSVLTLSIIGFGKQGNIPTPVVTTKNTLQLANAIFYDGIVNAAGIWVKMHAIMWDFICLSNP